jgi:hypothetical protein
LVKWFVTIFARLLSATSVARVWDLFLLDGWKLIFRLALAITARVQQRLLSMVISINWERLVMAMS